MNDSNQQESEHEPRISVVTATYNHGAYIAQAIESVRQQTYTNWELIIIDDGSTDDTASVIEPLLRDRRVYYHRREHLGSPCAKNHGVGLSRSALVAFLDADDAWLPPKLAKQIRLFDTDPGLGVAYTGLALMNEDGAILGPARRRMVRGYVLPEAVRRTIPPFSSAVIRREVFNEVGRFDESLELAIDYDLWLRVALKYRFDYIDEPLVLYRTGHASLSRRSAERRDIVLHKIMPAFLARSGVRSQLGRRPIAEAFADTYLNRAADFRPTSVIKSLGCHLRAIASAPWMPDVWWGLVRFFVPDWLLASSKPVTQPMPTMQGGELGGSFPRQHVVETGAEDDCHQLRQAGESR